MMEVFFWLSTFYPKRALRIPVYKLNLLDIQLLEYYNV